MIGTRYNVEKVFSTLNSFFLLLFMFIIPFHMDTLKQCVHEAFILRAVKLRAGKIVHCANLTTLALKRGA